MILLIDTTKEKLGRRTAQLLETASPSAAYEYVDTSDMKISHCLGCNYCWLKTPGTCCIKDDYEPLLKKMSNASKIWLITDTTFGFVSVKAKNIIDRVMPLVTMYLRMSGRQMRHVMRYDHNPDIGVIYNGEGDRDYLSLWCERTAVNFGTKSLGVYSLEGAKEAVSCMR